jgi:hypothetical protein
LTLKEVNLFIEARNERRLDDLDFLCRIVTGEGLKTNQAPAEGNEEQFERRLSLLFKNQIE